MTTQSQPIGEKARQQPDSAFLSPMDVVAAFGMSEAQKIATLERWAAQVHERLAATSEGMPANGRSAPDLAILEQIDKAIEACSRNRDRKSR